MKYHIYHYHIGHTDNEANEACVNFVVEATKSFAEVQLLAEATTKAVHLGKHSAPEVQADAVAGKFTVQCVNPDDPTEHECSPTELRVSAVLTRLITGQVMFVDGVDSPDDFGACYDLNAEAQANEPLDLTSLIPLRKTPMMLN